MSSLTGRSSALVLLSCLVGLLAGCSSGIDRVVGEWSLDPEASINEYLRYEPMATIEARDAIEQRLVALERVLGLSISEEEFVFTNAEDPSAGFRGEQSFVSEEEQKIRVEFTSGEGTTQLVYTLSEYGLLTVEFEGSPTTVRVGRSRLPFQSLVWYRD